MILGGNSFLRCQRQFKTLSAEKPNDRSFQFLRKGDGKHMLLPLDFSDHAIDRMARRDLTEEDIEYVLWYGRKVYCGGALHIFLGSRDMPKGDKRYGQLARLEGTTIVLDSQSGRTVITVYRNRRALRGIRRKSKRLIQKNEETLFM